MDDRFFYVWLYQHNGWIGFTTIQLLGRQLDSDSTRKEKDVLDKSVTHSNTNANFGFVHPKYECPAYALGTTGSF